jgi:hypothetical protein
MVKKILIFCRKKDNFIAYNFLVIQKMAAQVELWVTTKGYEGAAL